MSSRLLAFLLVGTLLAPGLALAQDAPAPEAIVRPPVVVRAVAVAETPQGLVGSVANVSISVAEGSGLLFMDTRPYTQVDMQGSARLAARVAGAVTGVDVSTRDLFFVVRSGSQIIGGPSAGGLMAVGAVAALMGWDVAPGVFMTGTINPDGSIGPVGGIPEKARAAAQEGARLFLYPAGEEITWGSGPQGRYLVNLSQFCPSELSIECRPVAHVEDAVTAFTGHAFERAPVATEADAARFRDAMRPLARAELDATAAALDDARARLREATNVPPRLRESLDARANEARVALLDGEDAYEADHHYTAASKAFVAAIAARTLDTTLRYLSAPDAGAYLQARFEEASILVDSARSRAATAPLPGLAQLEAVGAAQLRVTEAERTLAAAEAARAAGDPVAALDQLAFAVERADTVHWWLDIGESFAGGDPLDAARLPTEAREVLSDTVQLLTYVQETLDGGGYGAAPLSRAWDLYSRAQADLRRGFAAAAVFEALEAQVRAGLALESVVFEDQVPQARLDRARAEAGRAIAESRAADVEPVLAASHAEFASDLRGGMDRLAFYELARIVARSHDYFAGPAVAEPTPSRYVGLPVSPQSSPASHAGGSPVVLSMAWPAFVLGSLSAVLLVGLVRLARPRAPAPRTLEVVTAPPLASHPTFLEEPPRPPP